MDCASEAEDVVRVRLQVSPKLVPIYRHRFMPDCPNTLGNPIFSVSQSDTIRFGDNLAGYLHRKLRIECLRACGAAARGASNDSQKEKGSVVSFNITEETRLEGLYTFLSQIPVDPESYGVWISVITSSDQSGVSLPPYVRDLVRRTLGKMISHSLRL